MPVAKTRPTKVSVAKHIGAIANDEQRKDARTLVALMRRITGQQPRMWGPSIVGFGDWRYKSSSGREGDWFLIGFSPRKDSLTLYLMPGLQAHAARLRVLGKHKTGGSCLYIRQLAQVDQTVLKQLIADGVKAARKHAATQSL